MGNVKLCVNSRVPLSHLDIPGLIPVPIQSSLSLHRPLAASLPAYRPASPAHRSLLRHCGAMRLLWLAAGVLAVAQATLYAQSRLPESPEKLVREVAYNELQDHQGHGFWRFWIQRNLENGTLREDRVENAEGPISRLSLSNGHPLSPELEQQEQARLQRLLHSPWEQASSRQDYAEGEERIGRIVAMLPDAFVYENDSEENGCHRLRFRSNPAYLAHSVEARIFHAMGGTLCVDTRYKRLVQFNGQLQENVVFGFGILGRLRKGGWFQLKRTQVSATEWKTEGIEVHMSGHAVLFKAISRETSEVRGGFVQLPAGLNLAQGMKLLLQAPLQSEAQPPPNLHPRAR